MPVRCWATYTDGCVFQMWLLFVLFMGCCWPCAVSSCIWSSGSSPHAQHLGCNRLFGTYPWQVWFDCSTLGGSHPPIPRGRRPGCCTLRLASTCAPGRSSHKAHFHALMSWCSQTLLSPLNHSSLWAVTLPSASLCPSLSCFSFPASTAQRALLLSILQVSSQLASCHLPSLSCIYFIQTEAFLNN